MVLSGADIVVKTLIEQGCDVVFGYPGGQIINVYDSLYKYSDEIRHVLTAHEQGASHAADGYARATGKVGVVISTSGPGATNLVTGIATAYLDSVPMVAICGNVPTSQIGSDSFQEIEKAHAGAKFYLFSTHAEKNYCDVEYKDGDFLIFGKETAGLGSAILSRYPDNAVRIPMRKSLRSLNLSNSAAIAVYEALRQTGFKNLN